VRIGTACRLLVASTSRENINLHFGTRVANGPAQEGKKMTKWIASIVAIVAVVIVPASAFAQIEQPSQITIQGIGLFTRSTTNDNISHDATKSGGILAGYSYQFKPRLAFEANYGYSRNTQNYSSLSAQTSVETHVHEVTAGLLLRLPSNVRHVRPYVIGRSGALIFDPVEESSASESQRQTRMAFVYGGGADFTLASNFGIRAEYRGLIYKAPDFSVDSLNIDKFTHLAQPSVGFFYRF
jgi:opacity protein-like surface antigen